MPVALIIAIAVASGLASLSLLLLATFCLLRQRGKDVTDELGSLEARLSPVKRIRSNLQLQRHHALIGKGIGTRWPPILNGATYGTRWDSADLLEKSSLKPPLSSLSRPNASLSVPDNPSISRATTVTERSVYSTESAPVHFHDRLSNPLFMNRVVMSNITRANLPRGMKLPSNVTRDTGLFICPLPGPEMPNLPSNPAIRLCDNIYARGSNPVRTRNSSFDPGTTESSHPRTRPICRSAHLRTSIVPAQPLHHTINSQALRKTTSTSSFPPPLW